MKRKRPAELEMQRLTPYDYTPLDKHRDEIRLLWLSPSNVHDEPLSGHLKSVPLDEAPQFQSLSYVWGQSTSAQEPLYIGERTLQITLNLDGALRGVRRSYVLLPLWCDRICINQDDVEERSHQVHLMRRIFTTTHLVNIWLGPKSAAVEAAFDTLRTLAAGIPLAQIPNQVEIFDVNQLRNLMTVFEYPWWRRLWTIQEALLARMALVRCGSSSIDLETLMQAFELLWNQLIQAPEALRLLFGADTLQELTRLLEITVRRLHVTRSLVLIRRPDGRRAFRDDPSKWPMVLHTCSWSEATDARDKVYGTLGLFPSYLLEVDYAFSLRQTYSRSAFAIVKHLSNLAVLTQTVSQVSIDNRLPSWVPEWRHPAKETASLLVFYSYFSAGEYMPFDATLLDNESLQLSAQYVDQIVETGAVYNDWNTETAGELPDLLRPVLEDWIRLTGVPRTQHSSFLESFTVLAEKIRKPGLPPSRFAHTLGLSHTQQGQKMSSAYQPAQSAEAPVYRDMAYPAANPDRGVKRTADDLLGYTPQQSIYGPLYKDASYPPAAADGMAPQVGPLSGPRSYDPFSHTYGEQIVSTPGTAPADRRQAVDRGELDPSGTPASETFWRTLCMDIVEDRDQKRHRRCKSSDSWRIWEWVDWLLGKGGPAKTIPQLHWHLTTQLRGKRLVKTERGHISLVGRHVEVDDQLWILAGGAYPYVLRPLGSDSDANAFRFVSTAFVYGLMDGGKGNSDVDKITIR